jgi:hypothetical protein
MSDTKLFLARAEQLERIAAATKDPSIRHQLLDVAADWRRMAERAEHAKARSWKQPAGGSETDTP